LSRLLQKERGELLEQLLAELPQPQADALRLRFYGGLKFQEIADAMGCSLSSAKNRVRWGLEKMSARITSDDLAPVFEPADARKPTGPTGELT
jgi:RNA polymerase sigma-70 factor (ECF subfamily)